MKKLILVSMLYQVTDLVKTIEPELAGKRSRKKKNNESVFYR